MTLRCRKKLIIHINENFTSMKEKQSEKAGKQRQEKELKKRTRHWKGKIQRKKNNLKKSTIKNKYEKEGQEEKRKVKKWVKIL
jgi:hypothetical protein